MIKPIETVYAGYKFRSRLEARWAIALDRIGIKWDYEFEGFDLDGRWYLPDFWLPETQCWAEIKPAEFTDEQKSLCQLLAEGTGHPVILLDGMPENRPYSHRGPDGAGGYWAWESCLQRASGIKPMPLVQPPWNNPLHVAPAEEWTRAAQEYLIQKRLWSVERDAVIEPKLLAAIESAKQARFEPRKFDMSEGF